MRDEDEQQFAVALAMLARLTRTDLDEFTVQAYWRSLRDVPLDEFLGRVDHLVSNQCEWFPKPSALRNRGADYRRDLAKRTEETRKRLAGYRTELIEQKLMLTQQLEEVDCGLPQTEEPGLDSD